MCTDENVKREGRPGAALGPSLGDKMGFVEELAPVERMLLEPSKKRSCGHGGEAREEAEEMEPFTRC